MTGKPLGQRMPGRTKGVRRNGWARIVVQFDEETFDQIAAKADAQGCSFAQIVREGVEWMLMEPEKP